MVMTSDIPAIDPDQAALDRKRDLDIKEREVAAHEREILAKEEDLKRSRWLNPTVIGLFAASLGLIGSVVVARVNNANTQQVERLQSEANITLEAIKTGTGNTDAACKNLIFFVSLGLIRDPEGRINNQCKGAPTGPPSLPAIQGTTRTQGMQLHGRVIDKDTKKAIQGATVQVAGIESTFSGVTDSKGEFATVLPRYIGPGDELYVTARREGYISASVETAAGSDVFTMEMESQPKAQ
jgi:hypothetical protein